MNGIKFNRQELSGAFGDIGTDFPLIVAMILTTGLHGPSVLITFGLLQIFTGLVYKIPMPVQPLKAMATIVISQKIAGNILLGAGLAIGLVMFFLSLVGLLEKLTKLIPKAVVRGIQLGLGISLCIIALKEYIPSEQISGYLIAIVAFTITILLIDNKYLPVAFLIILLGVIYALIFNVNIQVIRNSIGINLPQFHIPTIEDIITGFVLLALPQIPLSLGNSIIATKQVTDDLFPEKNLSVKKIGITYSIMNLVSPFLSGVPCCHGSGGVIGHYTFGGRTGGSVVIYGIFYILLGLFFGSSFEEIVKVFPLPILGVILLFEGVAMMSLIKDLTEEKRDFFIAVLVGAIATGLPYGFVIAITIGTLIFYSPVRIKSLAR
ncbi:MAG: putative sulfate/molybdate transporter [Pyrinomonadaceae bacterium]|nr:putative sulfate/molybdate transporter [Pyrinomonadaceae bacterium]MCX7639285.1 putative sulfate/molybdate transporter [Pyrinomonadaceae bacterium]MDW8303493.1 putative sulfate/molybdate transporter [Acidobacteriota bacterium]